MKTNRDHFRFRAVLWLLSFVMMLTWAASGIVADTGESGHALVINFNATDVESCVITYTAPDGAQKTATVESGAQYLIKHGTEVTGTITPKTGKTVKSLRSSDSVVVPTIVNNGFSWKPFDSDATIEIVCVNRTYTVQALDLDLEGNVTYSAAGDMADHLYDLVNGNLKYTRDGASIELPTVYRSSYIFKGWRILSGDNNNYITIDPDAEGKYYLAGGLTYSSYFDINDTIYVYPVMVPEEYAIYRVDKIYDDVNAGRPLFTYTQQALVEQYYSALSTSEVIWADDSVDTDGKVTYKTYPGFLLYAPDGYYTSKEVYPTNPDDVYGTNRVERYYLPIEYELLYFDGLEVLNSAGLPATYTYATETEIPNPEKTGYTFTGWTVEIYSGSGWKVANQSTGTDFVLGNGNIVAGSGDNDPDTADQALKDANSIYASEKNPQGKYVIRLTANWKANGYEIEYNWNVSDATLKSELDTLNKPLTDANPQFIYDSFEGLMPIGGALRPGYTFAGWGLEYQDGNGAWVAVADLALNTEENKWLLPTNKYAAKVRLTAKWIAEEYAVLFDPMGGSLANLGNIKVTYDSKLVIADSAALIPTRTGYTFLGYFSTPDDTDAIGVKYINADGIPVDMLWKLDDSVTAGSVTLYARWEINTYDVSFGTNDGLPVGTVITVVTDVAIGGNTIHHLPVGEALTLPYGTGFAVSVTTPDGYKLVKFDGGTVAHTASYQTNLTVEAWDADGGKKFELIILPERTMVLPTIHYGNEQFLGLPAGSYLITWGDGSERVITIRENGETLDILDEWFGKELIFVYLGDGVNSSDSEPERITPAARPEAPSILGPDTLDAEILSISKTEHSLKVNMVGSLLELYEFAIFKYTGSTVDANTLVWQSSPEFTDLDPGTAYNLYVRKKATDDAPCGVYVTRLEITETKGYIDDIKQQLDDLLGDDAGEISKELIEDAKEQIDQWANELGAGDNFYIKVENLIQSIREEQLAIALAKDRAIAALRAFRDSCVATGFFIEPKIAELNSICNTAIDGIKNLTNCTEADIQAIYNSAMNAMKAVEIHRLTESDGETTITVESDKGLYQDSRLTLSTEQEFLLLIQAIDKAIRTPGMVTVNGFMTVAEAEETLRALDVFAFYRFDMTHSDKIKDGDVFTVRLKLTDALKDMTGLCAAYYNEATGVIELLDSRVEGDYLVFTTTRIADFVVMGDPTLRLEGVILALGTVLLCQLIAIIVVLATRSKAKKQVKHLSVALPVMALAVHFSPVNGELIALIMAGAVVLLQIILMALLLSSGMIRLPKKKKKEPAPMEKSEPAPTESYYADPAESYYAVPPKKQEAPVEEAVEPEETDVEDIEDIEDIDDPTLGAYAAVELDAEELAPAEEEADPFAFYDENSEAFSEEYSEDFIEPAAATRYSLPDDMYADVDEDVVDVEDATDAVYAEETYAEEEIYGGEEVYDEEAAEAEELYAEEAYVGEEAYADEDDYSDLYATVPVEEPVYADEDEVTYPEEAPATDELPADEDADSIYRYDE